MGSKFLLVSPIHLCSWIFSLVGLSRNYFSPWTFPAALDRGRRPRTAYIRASIMAKTSQRAVSVWGRSQTVTVNRISKSVWIVVGDYQGDRIEMQGSSQLSALSRWQEAARGKETFNRGVAYNELPAFLSAVVIVQEC